jgi:hypothetical protein
MGIYVLIGASVLGVLSSMLVAWSLWTRSQARKRSRQRQLASGQYAALPGQHLAVTGAGTGGYPPVGSMTAQVPGSAGHTVLARAPGEFEDEEPRTEFMGMADVPTQFLTDAEIFAQREPDPEADEHEVATAFLSEDELFGEAEPVTEFMTTEQLFSPAPGAEPARSMEAPVDRTIVLPPAPRPPAPQGFDAQPASKPTAPRRAAGASGGYVGFVGDRADDPDDDDDFDDDDPETELVHQAELLRLIAAQKPNPR